MVNYNCRRCGYSTINKTMFKRHLLRKNLCNAELEEISRYELLKINNFDILAKNYEHVTKCSIDVNPDVNPKLYICAYCNKNFKSRQGKYKHVKYYCKNKKEELFINYNDYES